MKAILGLLILVLAAPPAFGTVGIPIEEDDETAPYEIGAMGLCGLTTFVNVGMMASGDPNSSLAIFGIAFGAATIAFSFVDDTVYPSGLLGAGAVTSVVGLVALRYHMLSGREGVSLQAMSVGRSPGVALVVGLP